MKSIPMLSLTIKDMAEGSLHRNPVYHNAAACPAMIVRYEPHFVKCCETPEYMVNWRNEWKYLFEYAQTGKPVSIEPNALEPEQWREWSKGKEVKVNTLTGFLVLQPLVPPLIPSDDHYEVSDEITLEDVVKMKELMERHPAQVLESGLQVAQASDVPQPGDPWPAPGYYQADFKPDISIDGNQNGVYVCSAIGEQGGACCTWVLFLLNVVWTCLLIYRSIRH